MAIVGIHAMLSGCDARVASSAADGGVPPEEVSLSGAATLLGQWQLIETEQYSDPCAKQEGSETIYMMCSTNSTYDTRLFLFKQAGELRGQLQVFHVESSGGLTFQAHHKLFSVKATFSDGTSQGKDTISFCSAGSENAAGGPGGCYRLEQVLDASARDPRKLVGTLSNHTYAGSTRSWSRSVSFQFLGDAVPCTGEGASSDGQCLKGFCNMISGTCGFCLTESLSWQRCEEDCLDDDDCPSDVKSKKQLRICHAKNRTCYPLPKNGSCTEMESHVASSYLFSSPSVDGFCGYSGQLQ